MGKTVLVAAIVGLVVGLLVGILIKAVPAINGIIPDGWEGMIVGALAGGAAAFAAARVSNTPKK